MPEGFIFKESTGRKILRMLDDWERKFPLLRPRQRRRGAAGGSGGSLSRQFATISTYITFGGADAVPVIDEVLTYKAFAGRILQWDADTDYTGSAKVWIPNTDNEYAADFYRCIKANSGNMPPNVTYWVPIDMADEQDLNILSTEINGDNDDHRKYIPWFAAGSIVPVITIDSELFIDFNMIFTDNKSLGWLEDPVGSGRGRAASLFR